MRRQWPLNWLETAFITVLFVVCGIYILVGVWWELRKS